ncbi:NUDIX hydrolase [Actinomadura sp. ATCC 31491]|uniref:NUDIX hydrolase n=1 Tax=Actinomadura luzonensis TaxID=2805427 RepID=A0ABT0FZ15_9ACTN|nr:NUDIX hydrolase [Actinomadura luzonensis]MCK2217586.1 NUDIX hydrolase [Actinomadura luzonensis]
MSARTSLLRQIQDISPWDGTEAGHVADVSAWIAGGAPLYRTRRPDIPDPHLVSYFVALDGEGDLLLVHHRKSGLWLPSGGHVEPDEDPWDTVVRECQEELHTAAVPSPLTGPRPFFLTSTRTRGPSPHTDVSLWYVLEVEAITSYDRREFAGIRWLSPRRTLDEPLDRLDPHMHRFAGKLLAALS